MSISIVLCLQIAQELHVRITDLPISDRLRDLRQGHLNCLVRVSGGGLQ
jgi:DNA replication licensing factor MCM2